MQLIQPSEPAPIDIKKTMSTLEEVLENNQINGVIAEIVNDACAKISTSKHDKIPEPVANENEHKEDKGCNGITKTNGDSQIEHKVSELNKIESEVIKNPENESSANGESNECLSSESSKSPTSASASADISEVDENVDIEGKPTRDLVKDIEVNIATSDIKLTGDTEVENSSENVETQASVCNEEVPDGNISGQLLENDHLLVEDVTNPTMDDKSCEKSENNVPTNVTELNMPESQEIQSTVTESLEKNDDDTMSVPLKNGTIDAQMVDSSIVSNEKPLLETIQKEQDNSLNETSIEETTEEKLTSDVTENQDSIDITNKNEEDSTDEIEKLSENNDKKKSCSDIDMELDKIEQETQEESDKIKSVVESSPSMPKYISVKITNEKNEESTDDIEKLSEKNDNKKSCSDNDMELDKIELETQEESDKIKSVIESSPSKPQHISVKITNEKKEESTGDIEKLSEENDQKMSCSDIDMELDKIEIEKQEKCDKLKSVVESTPSMQKYISVKNITEMTNSVSPAIEVTKNNEATKVSSDQEIEVAQIHQKESMEVDEADVSIVVPENGNLDTTVKISIVENDVKTSVTDTTETNKIEVSSEENDVEVTEKDGDDVIMEIDDTDDVTLVEKSSLDSTVDKISEENTTADVNNSKYAEKQDSVINIIDNDDDEKSNEPENNEMKKDNISDVISIEDNVKDLAPRESEISSETEKQTLKVVERKSEEKEVEKRSKTPEKIVTKQLPVVCKLSNTMDILSDEEDEPVVKKPIEESKTDSEDLKTSEDQNKCINIDDDDDIMFIEDTNSPSSKNAEIQPEQECTTEEVQSENAVCKTDLDESEVKKIIPTEDIVEKVPKISEKGDSPLKEVGRKDKPEETKPIESNDIKEGKTIITQNFLKSVTKNLADMTRNELEDFCILKLVESVVDKSNLNEIKNKMKTMAQTVEDLRKKALALAKQNRDLQVVVKTVQEDQKKRNINPMMPMKITRSVGMQVVLTPSEKVIPKKKQIAPPALASNKPVRNNQTKTQKPSANIPVPRLVPASSPTIKSPVAGNATKITNKITPQRPEKRPHNKISPASSVTVDLTDDEPPTKVNPKTPPVRLVPSQNLMAKTRPQFNQPSTSPRKVYIPISSTNQNMRPGTGVIRNFVPTPRNRQPSVVRMQAVRLQTPTSNRHPAPLPDAMKQYQPPAWKALPPAPDLKLSKVDNGIVISWKFEGYQPDSYEEVASFQLYAYQETPAPPSTALWKKIGDIKALPLPMACTLTQFMSGFKYYFAVRAIDVRSRIGPFSLPGSIMLISKT